MIHKNAFTFEDIEKLNYQQINMVSNKYGEDEFNPNEFFGHDDDVSESDQDEILRRYKPRHHPTMSVDQASLGAKKQSLYSH